MIKITSGMRRMARDVDFAKVVAQVVAAEDAVREYEQRLRHNYNNHASASRLVPLAELARRPSPKVRPNSHHDDDHPVV